MCRAQLDVVPECSRESDIFLWSSYDGRALDWEGEKR
jgi:hypothetical protein